MSPIRTPGTTERLSAAPPRPASTMLASATRIAAQTASHPARIRRTPGRRAPARRFGLGAAGPARLGPLVGRALGPRLPAAERAWERAAAGRGLCVAALRACVERGSEDAVAAAVRVAASALVGQ